MSRRLWSPSPPGHRRLLLRGRKRTCAPPSAFPSASSLAFLSSASFAKFGFLFVVVMALASSGAVFRYLHVQQQVSSLAHPSSLVFPSSQSQSSVGDLAAAAKWHHRASDEAAYPWESSSADGGTPEEDPLVALTALTDVRRHPPRVFTCRCYPQVKYAFATRGFYMKADQDDYQGSWIVWKTGTDIDAKRLQPWQRPNHFPGERQMDRKGTMYQVLRLYGARTGTDLDFLPETYLLYTQADKDAFVQRLAASSDDNDDHSRGMDMPWVLKRATASRGRGVTMLGPNSPELRALRDQLVDGPIKRGHIVQSYIKNEWTFQGHKCDLRVYVLVASVDPLIVYYHDGIVRTAAGLHDEDDFSENKSHLTNVSQNKKNRTAWEPVKTFDELQAELQAYVQSPAPHKVPNGRLTMADPMNHVRDQIKRILGIVFAAFRNRISLEKIPSDNAFALMGADFVIDQDLKVWLLEMQLGPQLLGDNHAAKTAVLQDVLTTTIDVVEEVYHKQAQQQPLLPLDKAGNFALVYSDLDNGFEPAFPE